MEKSAITSCGYPAWTARGLFWFGLFLCFFCPLESTAQDKSKAVTCHGLLVGSGQEHIALSDAGPIDTQAHETFGAFVEGAGAIFRFYLPNALAAEVLLYDETTKAFSTIAAKAEENGVWEAHAENFPAKGKYLLRVTAKNGRVYNRLDPFSLYVEPMLYQHAIGPETHWVSVLWPRGEFKEPVEPLVRHGLTKLMEIHPSTYVEGEPDINIVDLVERYLVPDLKKAGVTDAAFMPLQQRDDGAHWWGGYKPGAMFSPTFRHGTPSDYRKAFQILRKNGIGVILDFVSGHAEIDTETGLTGIDGTDLYYHESEELGHHPEYKSRLYDFTRPHVLSFLLSNARFWMQYYGVDGLRVDCLEIIFYHPKRPGKPHNHRSVKSGGRDYLTMLTRVVHTVNPAALMIAEDSTADHVVTKPRHSAVGGLGFDFRWNFWGQDVTVNAMKSAMKGHPNVFPLLDPIREQDSLGPTLNMVVNHDTINSLHWHQHPADFISDPSISASDRRRIFLLGTAWTYLGVPGRPMIFQGDQFAQPYDGKGWSDDSSLLPAPKREQGEHLESQRVHSALSTLFDTEAAFKRMDGASSHNLLVDSHRHDVLVQVREAFDPQDTLVIVQNWGQHDFVGDTSYRIPVPSEGHWEVIFNSDEPQMGGRGLHKKVGVAVAPGIFHSPAALAIDLPRHTTLVLKKVRP